MRERYQTYLGWKSITVYGVLGSELIVESVMDMNFLKLIFVRERTAGHVDMMTGVIIYCKYYAMSGIAY